MIKHFIDIVFKLTMVLPFS